MDFDKRIKELEELYRRKKNTEEELTYWGDTDDVFDIIDSEVTIEELWELRKELGKIEDLIASLEKAGNTIVQI